jgi:hypothetical protein
MAGLVARLEQVDRDLTIVGDLDRVAAVFEQPDGELLIHLVVLSEKDVELDLLGLVGWQRGVRFESRKERARAEGSNSRSAAVVLFDAETGRRTAPGGMSGSCSTTLRPCQGSS